MLITHERLLQSMEKMGYQVDENGMCFGFACMGMQAILADDLETYNRRLEALEKIPLENLVSDIDNIKKKVRAKQSLTEDEEIILSIPAFFDGVALYFHPDQYPSFFEKETRPRTQNAELTFPRALSHKLTTQEEKEEKVNVEKAGSFSGIYNLQKLKGYFKILRTTIEEQKYNQPISFILVSSTHAVTVGYDPKRDCWQWIDASNAEEIKTDDKIAERVMNAFSENSITTFSTEVYCKKTEVDQVKKYLAACQEKKVWKDIFRVTQ